MKNEFGKSKIMKIVLTPNHEEVLLRTNMNEFYMWRTDEL